MNRTRLEMLTLRRELEATLSNLDPLTGLANRFGMLTWLREQHALAERGVQSSCVAMLDLDHFKNVNDQYGHQVGDAVLVRTAQCALEQVRPYDKLFRYGGEEFLLCMPNTEELAANEICNRVRERIAAIQHVRAGETPFCVTVSIGLAWLDPSVTVEESLERADKALYAAKHGGRNRNVVWDLPRLVEKCEAL
jgi:diguanylate cyclase (GGDEF)-like protein